MPVKDGNPAEKPQRGKRPKRGANLSLTAP